MNFYSRNNGTPEMVVGNKIESGDMIELNIGDKSVIFRNADGSINKEEKYNDVHEACIAWVIDVQFAPSDDIFTDMCEA